MATWPRETSAHANQMADRFKDRLKGIAESFADHEGVDSVSKKHVDDSYFALARIGLEKPTWYQRSDTWSAFGALLVGASLSMPDVCSVFIADEDYRNACSSVSLVAALVAGCGLVIWAKMSGSIPRIKRQ